MALHLTFTDFELDEARFELRRRGNPVTVQPKVLDLLIYLARHRDRLVTKDELLATVWKGIAVTEASLTQAVSLARRAIDDTPDAQQSIRTIRSKGFQFVAACHVAAPRRAAAAVSTHRSARAVARAPVTEAGITLLETARDESPRSTERRTAAHLFAVLHCERPDAGGAGWSLAGVDEVRIVRGSERRAAREAGSITCVLTLTLPGRLMSRLHARIVRTASEWLIVDERSKNGTFVNGERVDKRPLRPGDLIECGRTLLRFADEPAIAGAAPDADSRGVAGDLLPTVTPGVAALARDLERLAPTDLPILLLGESGVGKTHVAHGLHGRSGRRGPLVSLDLGTLASEGPLSGAPGSPLEQARSGTLLLESLERIRGELVGSLLRAIESTPDVRFVCTCIGGAAGIAERLPADLVTRVSGFRCELPPLRERGGDLGLLVASVLRESGRTAIEFDAAAGRALVRHAWPGNVRELARTLEVAAALSHGGPIGLEHLPPEMRARPR